MPVVPTVAQTDASCARCHADIYKRYLATPMANASGDAMQAVVAGGFTHAGSGVTYRVSVENGRAWLSYTRPSTGLAGKKQLELFVGSGHRGRTYLFNTEGWWFEAPLNYYASTGGYDMAPNMHTVTQMPFTMPVDSGCLHCHASAVQMEEPGSINRFHSYPFLQGGITCEACHGDTAQHVASGGKAAVLNPDKLTPERRDAVCFRCHLEGESNVKQPGRSPAEFKPGDRLEDYVTYFIHQGAPNADKRSVSEVEALGLSQCKRASGDRMTCTICHDPHGDPAPEQRAAFYRAKCLTCHAQEKFVSLASPHAHHPEQPDCTACHMPSQPTQDVAHTQTTDHRIPRIPGMYDSPAAPVAAGTHPQWIPLVPVPGTTATQRDLAVATFNRIAAGDPGAAEAARPLLETARTHNPKDAQVLADLGWLDQQAGHSRQAANDFLDALDVDPNMTEARTDLGVLFAQAGALDRAANDWRAAFERNPFISELGNDLAEVDCRLGRPADAEQTLRRLLLFSPDDHTAAHMLQQIEAGNLCSH